MILKFWCITLRIYKQRVCYRHMVVCRRKERVKLIKELRRK